MRRTTQIAAVVVTASAAMLLSSPAALAAGNRDWGKVASNLAQLDTSHSTTDDGEDAKGGGMGQHSRSTQAANNNGGFTAQDTDGDGDGGNGFGIEFNTDSDGDGDSGRLGVGNATRSDPHNEPSPSNGGQGRHALNNADAAETLDPVTGDFTENAGGDAPDFSDELREGTSADSGDSDSGDSGDSDSGDSDSGDSDSGDSDN